MARQPPKGRSPKVNQKKARTPTIGSRCYVKKLLGRSTQTMHPAPPDLVSTAHRYQDIFGGETANQTGTFYTPPWLARAMVAATLGPRLRRRSTDDLTRLRILDPACGSGVFLLAALEALHVRLATLNAAPRLGEIAALTLHGVDRDGAALLTARQLLTTALGDMSLAERYPAQLVCRDALLTPIDELFETPRLFDVIIGNPPYGISRDEQLSDAENSALRRIFAATLSGRVNKYLAFIARSYELLAPHGTLALVVPNAWLAIKEATKLREMLLDAGALREVVILPPRTFEGLGVETVVLIADKGAHHNHLTIRRHGFGPRLGGAHLPYGVCRAQPGQLIPIEWSTPVARVWRHLGALSTVVDSPLGFAPRIALQAYAVGKGTPPQSPADVANHIFHSRHPGGEDHYRYLNGGDVRRYRIQWSGEYLHHGPWLAEPQRIDRFHSPRIVIREILGALPYAIAATYTTTPYLYNKSILHIGGASPEALRALLVILNSRLGTFILRTRGRKGARGLFPKILADDLKSFPLPPRFENHIIPLASLAPPEDLPTPCPADDARRDDAVFQAYEFDAESIATVERFTQVHVRDE
jgi:methylase of polypeptide subunit release factors